MQTRGVLVDYRAVNSAMSACSKSQKYEMILKLYDQMPTVTGHTFIPNQYSYSLALSAACKLKNVDKAIEVSNIYAKRSCRLCTYSKGVSYYKLFIYLISHLMWLFIINNFEDITRQSSEWHHTVNSFNCPDTDCIGEYEAVWWNCCYLRGIRLATLGGEGMFAD